MKMSKEIECGAVTLDTPIKIISTDTYRSVISIGEGYYIVKVHNEDVMEVKKALEKVYKLGYSDASCELLNQPLILPPKPPKDRLIKEGDIPPKPKQR